MKRIKGEEFPATKFSLGRAGYILNTVAISFLMLAFVFVLFPAAPNPSVVNMNWAVSTTSMQMRE